MVDGTGFCLKQAHCLQLAHNKTVVKLRKIPNFSNAEVSTFRFFKTTLLLTWMISLVQVDIS